MFSQLLKFLIIFLLVAVLTPDTAQAQKSTAIDSVYFGSLKYRNIGPFRGGRSAAVAGVPGKPTTFYFGGTGGGVWKTHDGGQSWKNISDGFFGGSIGAVAISEWDPNVIYVGGGEKTVRGNVSHGYGMWKSLDAGKTWKQSGLTDSRRIARIRIHPRNPDLVYAAVMGHLFGPNQQRGVFRSTDGGTTWKKILFVNPDAGAVDLAMDPTNSRILYACFWRIRRTPHSLESGGEGSTIWKSIDGGETWKEITYNNGLPGGLRGISGIAVSPANPERVWAIIESAQGGVFRSEDGGENWQKINDERKLRQRAWYYTRIYADPQNVDGVYVLNVRFWRSGDGGKSYEQIRTPHGDHHDLWIDPDDPQRMVVGDDGGAQVSYDGGSGWSTYHNQPTAQFYRVTTDNHFPYRIYGAQQDNSTVRILHRSEGRYISENDWEPTAGGESGHIAPHPENPDIVYGGSYGGYLTRLNHRTGEERAINVWPDNPMGYGAGDLRYRFQWNFPILFSPHDNNTLYAAGNVLFKTNNEGHSWQAISPDLTRNDSSKLGSSGGPITKDNTSVEYYATIFAVAESHHEKGVIWCGSDDGLLHLTRDGGTTWVNVTPPKKLMPEWMQINGIDIHPTEKGGLYVAGTRYKLDDFAPYLFKTTDYGKTWKKITRGIDNRHFTRAIRADRSRSGLLYAGTESGMYISFDDGALWQPFQLNLPIVPITDLALKDNDLIVATQGRSFWVLDDLTPLHQTSAKTRQAQYWLYQPRDAYRMWGRSAGPSLHSGENLPAGVMLHYYFADMPDSQQVALKILDKAGKTVRHFRATDKDNKLTLKKGMNRFTWDLSYEDAESFDGMINWTGNMNGPRAIPGEYQARLVNAGDSMTVNFAVLKDPRSTATSADIETQFKFLMEVREKVSEVHKTIEEIRILRSQVKTVIDRYSDNEDAGEIVDSGKKITERLTAVEETLYQTKNQSRQDPLNFPIRLNDRLCGIGNMVIYSGDYPPTAQTIEVKNLLFRLINQALDDYRKTLEEDLPAFNTAVAAMALPAVEVPAAE